VFKLVVDERRKPPVATLSDPDEPGSATAES
jgi:hypothetical protein